MKHYGIFALVIVVLALGAGPVRGDAPKLIGTYFCQVTDGDTVYPPMRCSITRTRAGALLFEKSGGSQRLSGIVLPADAGQVRFTGLFFCPQGSCDELVTSNLTPAATGDGWEMILPLGGRQDYVVTVSKRRPTRPPTP